MARSQANLQLGIFKGLQGVSPMAKLLYVEILVEPTVNQAGVGALRVGRWARELELPAEEVHAALMELDGKRFVLVDEDTDEILVRTLIRNDGVAEQPNVLRSALRAAVLCESPRLRLALAEELRKLPPAPPPTTTRSGKPFHYPDPHATAAELDPEGTPALPVVAAAAPPPPAPAENPSANPSGTLPGTLGGGGGGGGGGTSPAVGGYLEAPPTRAHTREAHAREAHQPPLMTAVMDPPEEPANPVPALTAREAVRKRERARLRPHERGPAHIRALAASARTGTSERLVQQWNATLATPVTHARVVEIAQGMDTALANNRGTAYTDEQLLDVVAYIGGKGIRADLFEKILGERVAREAARPVRESRTARAVRITEEAGRAWLAQVEAREAAR